MAGAEVTLEGAMVLGIVTISGGGQIPERDNGMGIADGILGWISAESWVDPG